MFGRRTRQEGGLAGIAGSLHIKKRTAGTSNEISVSILEERSSKAGLSKSGPRDVFIGDLGSGVSAFGSPDGKGATRSQASSRRRGARPDRPVPLPARSTFNARSNGEKPRVAGVASFCLRSWAACSSWRSARRAYTPMGDTSNTRRPWGFSIKGCRSCRPPMSRSCP